MHSIRCLTTAGAAFTVICFMFASCSEKSSPSAPPPKTYGIADLPGEWAFTFPAMPPKSPDSISISIRIHNDSTFNFVGTLMTANIPLMLDSGKWTSKGVDTIVFNGSVCMLLDTASKQLVPFTMAFPQYTSIPPVNIPVKLPSANAWNILVNDMKPLIYAMVSPTDSSSAAILGLTLQFKRK